MSDGDGQTIAALLGRGTDSDSAIGSPGWDCLSHGGLRALAARTAADLNRIGIGRSDRVAMVLPNGPQAASAFLCVARVASTAPLNPAYRADELRFYLGDLQPRALIVQRRIDGPARTVAAELGIPVIELVPDEVGPAGRFTLSAPDLDARSQTGGPAQPDDVALLLHTSGTTSRPKLVPLSHANLAASARHIGAALALQPGDVCLNIMPLFHIHGLIAAVLASVAAGAAVCCTPGFNAFRFYGWFADIRPTWFTAVPTMHQTLLDLAPRHAETIAQGRLRLIRSSSASLPPQVMQAMEAAFGVPVIESYGMTEAAHQMASSPLPPRGRFAGSVGVAAGPDIGIMDADGRLLPPGALGEIVIRGPNVTSGYVNNPAANETAFAQGWFRTGDQGTLDAQGYLRLTGRLKEQINRGGEKISPLEVDTVLMDHPAVAQIVTFGLPHDKLGEEVAAAVVLRAGMTATEHALRDFAAARLAPFKVPRRIVFVDEIPKGATGKLQRIGLAQRLGLTE